MAVFSSEKQFDVRLPDLQRVAEDVAAHFRAQHFEVACEATLVGSWHIDIHKGGLFKAAVGMKAALKIEIQPTDAGTLAKAGVGIFGTQVVPTALMLFVTWPVIIPQIWGMVKQAKLDNEALQVIEESLKKHSEAAGQLRADGTPKQFCTKCGSLLQPKAKFCGECGTPSI